MKRALLLIDVGNTHTHIGLSDGRAVRRRQDFETLQWKRGSASRALRQFLGRKTVEGVSFCSVVPKVNPAVQRFVRGLKVECLQLTAQSIRGIGIDYPRPSTIGTDRLANALAVCHHFGAPSLVVDFGTAVTFDVVDRRRCYVGGVIAPGLAAMTDYLHEKTALLPRIRIRETRSAIGRSTEQAMLIGATRGYRGLVRQLVLELCEALGVRRLPVVATGGYARLIAARMPEITAVMPDLTLEGLRLAWEKRSRR